MVSLEGISVHKNQVSYRRVISTLSLPPIMKESLRKLLNPPPPPSPPPRALTWQEREANEWLSNFKSNSISTAVEKYSSVLPIRVIDLQTTSFVTRRQAFHLMDAELAKACEGRDLSNRWQDKEAFETEMDELAEAKMRLAILSHTWGANELTYRDVMTDPGDLKWDPKFAGLCKTAKTHGCRYVWMDSVCIDKSSSSELDESIRSMYAWYASAYVCFVYLQHGHHTGQWLYRGWTLQELIAPKKLVFFDQDWHRAFSADTKEEEQWLAQVWSPYDAQKSSKMLKRPSQWECNSGASDDEAYTLWDQQPSGGFDFMGQWLRDHAWELSAYDLLHYKPSADNARMIFRYMRYRDTTVPEDAAYCLLGLLGIVLTPAYGEGRDSALYRLQVACAERSNDRGIFFWQDQEPSPFNSMLPSNPFSETPGPACCEDEYGHLNHAFSLSTEHLWKAMGQNNSSHSFVDHTFMFTNSGLRISVILHDCTRITHSTRDYFVINDTIQVKAIVDETLPSSSLFKVAVLGTYGCNRPGHTRCFMIILLKCGPRNIPQYRRVSRKAWDHYDYGDGYDLNKINPGGPDNTEYLLARVPETVYIV